jgi:hypothetical protein
MILPVAQNAANLDGKNMESGANLADSFANCLKYCRRQLTPLDNDRALDYLSAKPSSART